MNILRIFPSRSQSHFSPSLSLVGIIRKESPVRSIATLLPSIYTLAMSRTKHTNLISTGSALHKSSSSSASVPTQQDQAAWSYKGMSKKQVEDQIDFLNKTLRDMTPHIKQLELKKLGYIEKSEKSANDMLALDEIKEQLKEQKEFQAEYKAELRELQEAIGSSTSAITPKGNNTNTINHHSIYLSI